MTRTSLLIALLTSVGTGGAAIVSANVDVDRPVPLVAAGATEDEATPASTAEPDLTTTTAAAAETTTTTAAPTTTTAAPRTRTTAAPDARPLKLRCAGSGDTKRGDGGEAWVYCELGGVHERAAHLTLSRDGAVIARTDDTGITSYKDHEVRPGQTYSYQAHSYTADGRLLQTSDAVRATTAPEERRDGPLALYCAGSATKTGDDDGAAYVVCEWTGVPERAAGLTLTRDGETIARTDDTTVARYKDDEVRPGSTHSYQVHAYAADGTLIESSDAVRATAGGTVEPQDDGPLVMRCAGSAAKTGDDGAAYVVCEWKGVPERAASLSLTRDGETIAETDDPTIARYKDLEVRPGVTYSYQVHAFAADGTLIESSDAIRATPGASGEGA